MRLGCIADDFTGATDLANNLVRAGMRVVQTIGVPPQPLDAAVDAVIATAIALTVLEPTSNGIGSDAFAILWDGKKLRGLNASGRSPAAWTPERFKDAATMPMRGWNAVTVPGCVSAWVEMSKQYGKLPFADLFEPAIEYAEQGYMVTPTIARLWANQVPELKSQPGFAAAFGNPDFYQNVNDHVFKYMNNVKPVNEQKNANFSIKGEWDTSPTTAP